MKNEKNLLPSKENTINLLVFFDRKKFTFFAFNIRDVIILIKYNFI
jgi:hypothetical protein